MISVGGNAVGGGGEDTGTITETGSVTESNGTRIDTEKVTDGIDGSVTETETVTAPVIPGAIQTVTETKTVTKDGVMTKSEEKTEKIEDDVDASLINARLNTLAALPLPQQLKLPLPADGVLLKSEQSGRVPGLKIEVVTEKKSVDGGDLQIEKVIFIASLTTTEVRSAARKLQQTF